MFAFSCLEAAFAYYGWAPPLRSFATGAPQMTFLSALLFGMASLLVGGIYFAKQDSTIGPFTVGTLTISILGMIAFEQTTTISGRFAYEVPIVLNPQPGHPSPCTMAGIALLATGGLAWALRWRRFLCVLGAGAVFIGLLALVGYAIDVPKLYCYFGPDSTAMAIPTALCLVVLGMSEAATILWMKTCDA